MPKQTRPDDEKQTMPNQAANQEPTEGSRETVLGGDEGGGAPRGERKEAGRA